MARIAVRAERKRWMELLERLPALKREEILSEAERYAQEVERRIKKLLRPRTRKGGAGYVVQDKKTLLWGTGDSKEAAYEDYKKALETDYQLLLENEHRLGDDLKRQLQLLRSIFEGEV